MKKFLCGILALTTLVASTFTAVSCGGGNGGETSSSVSSLIDVSKVTLRLTKKVYNIENEQSVSLEIEFTEKGEELNPSLLQFESSDSAIATVTQEGVVTGIAGGRAYVYVTYGTKTVKATINVTMKENYLTVSDESFTLLIGDTKQVTATAKFGLTEIENPALTWVSSNPEIATVENGLITAVASGKAEITVTYENVFQTVAVTVVEETTQENVNSFSETYVNRYGRTYVNQDGLQLDAGATAVEVGFVGTSLKVSIYSTGKSYMRVFIDGDETGKKSEVSIGTNEYTAASGLADGLHTVRIVKASGEESSTWTVKSFDADGFYKIPENDGLKIEFIGSSTVAGYGVYGSLGQEGSVENTDASKSFAYIAAHELNANYSVVSYVAIGVSIKWWVGDWNMETLYGLYSSVNRTPYDFNFNPDIVVINLGSVESSYIQRPADGDPSYSSKFQPDYQRFLTTVRDKNPNAYIICLYGTIHQNVMIANGIRASIEALGDDKIVYNPFEIESNTDGAINHPGSQAQKTWGQDLATYIQSLEL